MIINSIQLNKHKKSIKELLEYKKKWRKKIKSTKKNQMKKSL